LPVVVGCVVVVAGVELLLLLVVVVKIRVLQKINPECPTLNN
jgi:hypothetical protein